MEEEGRVGKICGVSINAGSECTAFPSSHSQPRIISSSGLRSRRAKTPNARRSESEQMVGRRTAFGRQPFLTKRDLSPDILASRARLRGGPMRWTNGFGMPRWAYALRGSAR